VSVRNGVPDPVLGTLYPFEDRYTRLDDGTTLHWIEMGSAGWRRPTFLLLHGNPTWSFLWRDWMLPLSRLGRVVAVDHAGFGRSDHPRDPRYHRLDRHVRNLEELVSRLRLKRVVPIVHDWGGPIGLGYATRHPEDLRGIVVMDTWAFTRKVRLRLPWWYKALRLPRVGEWAYTRRNMALGDFMPRLLRAPMDPAVTAGYAHPFPTAQSRAALVGMPRMVPDSPEHPDWSAMDRIERSLAAVDVPALPVWGAQDPVFPKRFAWAFKDALPRSMDPVFVDAGHWPQEDAGQASLASVMAFAKRL
jgi:cis-3-alkyl-4-acyloxetan-2-one decarboxylase